MYRLGGAVGWKLALWGPGLSPVSGYLEDSRSGSLLPCTLDGRSHPCKVAMKHKLRILHPLTPGVIHSFWYNTGENKAQKAMCLVPSFTLVRGGCETLPFPAGSVSLSFCTRESDSRARENPALCLQGCHMITGQELCVH